MLLSKEGRKWVLVGLFQLSVAKCVSTRHRSRWMVSSILRYKGMVQIIISPPSCRSKGFQKGSIPSPGGLQILLMVNFSSFIDTLSVSFTALVEIRWTCSMLLFARILSFLRRSSEVWACVSWIKTTSISLSKRSFNIYLLLTRLMLCIFKWHTWTEGFLVG